MSIKNNNFNIIIILLFALVSSLIIAVFYGVKDLKVEEAMNSKYKVLTQKIQDETKLFIDNKTYATLSIAMSLAENGTLKKAIKANDIDSVKLKEFSASLRKHTNFKNVWFSVVSKDGKCFYRSWTDNYGDLISKKQQHIAKLLKEPKISSMVNIGGFDLVFKSIVPIYDGDKFLGLLQVITHFNSVAKKIIANGFEPIILVDKKYRKLITNPFTNTFINDYYVANLDANKDLMNIIKQDGVENIIKLNQDYKVDTKNDLLISTYNISSFNDDKMAYVIFAKPLKNIEMDDIKSLEQNITFFMLALIAAIAILGYYFSNRRYNQVLSDNIKQIESEKEKIYSIMDVQPSIIVLTNGRSIQDANSKFFKFFKYKTLEEFKGDHDCICDFFTKNEDAHLIENDNELYIHDKVIDGKSWADYILDNSDKIIKTIIIDSDNKPHHFTIKVKETTHGVDNRFVVATFIDITNEIENTKKSLEQEKKMFESSKMAQMGEMIGNIAHQWRQPLSAITTAASGMKLEKEFGTLNDKEFMVLTDGIMRNAQFLSETIDTFRDFIREKKEVKDVVLQDRVDTALEIVRASLENNQIELIRNIDSDESMIIHIPVGELSQVIINILNNAKDVLVEKNVNEPWVKVIVSRLDGKAVITIEDNGGGIPDSVLPKIFDPYFTTKHQSQGTGLGLHMCYNIITQSLNGKIYVENTVNGAKFFIELPLNS